MERFIIVNYSGLHWFDYIHQGFWHVFQHLPQSHVFKKNFFQQHETNKVYNRKSVFKRANEIIPQ